MASVITQFSSVLIMLIKCQFRRSCFVRGGKFLRYVNIIISELNFIDVDNNFKRRQSKKTRDNSEGGNKVTDRPSAAGLSYTFLSFLKCLCLEERVTLHSPAPSNRSHVTTAR